MIASINFKHNNFVYYNVIKRFAGDFILKKLAILERGEGKKMSHKLWMIKKLLVSKIKTKPLREILKQVAKRLRTVCCYDCTML